MSLVCFLFEKIRQAPILFLQLLFPTDLLTLVVLQVVGVLLITWTVGSWFDAYTLCFLGAVPLHAGQ